MIPDGLKKHIYKEIVLLIDIDSTIPNLALHKIEQYYREDYEVIWNMPLFASQAKYIYVSCIFDWNKEKAKEWELYPNAYIGGTGYDIKTKLPEEIENIKPKINYGFTTRGCIRKCGFCVVPKKEGSIRIVGDLLDIWDGKSKSVSIMDNNILAVPKHFKLICKQAQDNNIKIDFNQGLDHRLLTPEIAETLSMTPKLKQWRFSFDSTENFKTVDKAIKILKDYNIRGDWYVLVGYNSGIKSAFTRMNYLREQGQSVFCQRYRKTTKGKKEWTMLAKWSNSRAGFILGYGDFVKHIKKMGATKLLTSTR